jgi:prevent-host-death family protein
MSILIEANSARRRLPELLREVRAGKRYTITTRGEAIADLVPSAGARHKSPSVAIDRFRAFMKDNPARATSPRISELIKQGRA